MYKIIRFTDLHRLNPLPSVKDIMNATFLPMYKILRLNDLHRLNPLSSVKDIMNATLLHA